MRQTAGLRTIARLEAHLLAFSSVVPTLPERRRRDLAMAAAIMPSVAAGVIQLVLHRGVLAAWPAWRPVVLDLMGLAAAATLVAAVAAGIHAWRQHA